MSATRGHEAQPSAFPLYKSPEAAVYHCSHQELAQVVALAGRADALVVDAPYSARTHAGHDIGTARANRVTKGYVRRDGTVEPGRDRRGIAYAHWADADVAAFVEAWRPAVRGWWVSLTDSVLAESWARRLEESGLYVFSPIACVDPGSRVRMTGDGPSQWSCWAVVARPRSARFAKWGTLPGAYVVPLGQGEPKANTGAEVVGGKPLWLMERLVEDYSRPGDVVVDPCCGAGTTLRAALRTGRRAVGSDVSESHARLAAKLLDRAQQRPLFVAGASKRKARAKGPVPEQPSLFAEGRAAS